MPSSSKSSGSQRFELNFKRRRSTSRRKRRYRSSSSSSSDGSYYRDCSPPAKRHRSRRDEKNDRRRDDSYYDRYYDYDTPRKRTKKKERKRYKDESPKTRRHSHKNHKNKEDLPPSFFVTREVSFTLVNWLRYMMRERYPQNKSNWVPWAVLPGPDRYTEQHIEDVAADHNRHLEVWRDEDTKMLYVRSKRKNKIESEGNDISFWNGKDLSDEKELANRDVAERKAQRDSQRAAKRFRSRSQRRTTPSRIPGGILKYPREDDYSDMEIDSDVTGGPPNVNEKLNCSLEDLITANTKEQRYRE
ncbi:unnamed protein product [Amoebophrya sp. A25]|nr:unnamed protein product [Amoebophrya sp. A25]|eukprot:GSA25T00006392001.1